MELIGGLLVGLGVMALLAGVGVAALVALAAMTVLHFLTEMSFRKVFLVSCGIGLLGPIFLGLAISSAVADGSIERDLRAELGDVIQLPDDQGENWRKALEDLRDISQENERGDITEEEAERRVEAVLAGFEDLQISIDVNGDGIVIGDQGTEEGDTADDDSGVPLELPDAVEVPAAEEER